uniref:Anthranilate synthase component 2 n=1 Tax=Anotrichium furcellatum TaxID=41999 RepID=A0A4D6WKA9_9FLOR|nr:Anthranilate synthase component II [Anotrichium furcellatum]
MILLIDNYDSFTYNLAQYVGSFGFKLQVFRNNQIEIKTLEEIKPTHIILSPGPGHPRECNLCLKIIQEYANQIPILGICLGHQAIGYIHGASIKQLNFPMHGKISMLQHNSSELFYNISNPFHVTRYHSLIIDHEHFPNELEITAWTSEGLIMACKHKKHRNLHGIQFHPESLWTDQGQMIIKNFLMLK